MNQRNILGEASVALNAKELVLKSLKEKDGKFVSGEKLSAELKVTRAAVWKQIQALRKDGYTIESKPKLGYRLLGVPDVLFPWEIQAQRGRSLIGHSVHRFDELDSTMDKAEELAQAGGEEGLVVVAETQKRGKGRMGRMWLSPQGGVWLSIILRPKIHPRYAPILSLMAAVAVARAIWRVCHLEAKLKWPNDVLLEGRKVSGILTKINAETDLINYVIVGVGVNVNVNPASLDPRLREAATCLKDEAGREISRTTFVQVLLEEKEKLYRLFLRRDFTAILNAWKRLSDTLGRWVRVEFQGEAVEGEAVDLDGTGGLLLKLADGSLRQVLAGDVKVLRNR
ncbi:biotin--[acetyl-CoA-carboxylase] ligase [Candidatus Hecatella orcuttiae]|uniref:biotin--[acetyl-CoA-carboxylase] ligase n=1 Tax=Candidatus Hecatella orcuttiae TaxID=1935119 RepID=UPI002868321E|nr:biotin--[acetyl-CoA-carboxylase] ligase [Candidatus Hecatella orcuttiae]